MKIAERIWEPVRRAGLWALGGNDAGAPQRKTASLPSALQRYGSGTRPELLPKKTPEALRRFAETPIARKAINTIKDRVAGMNWRIQPRRGRVLDEDMRRRIQVLTETLEQPNPDDSFRSFAEQVLEDIIVGGYGAMEMRLTGDDAQPLALYPVDGATIQMRSDWNGEPDKPRYVQMTSAVGGAQKIELNDNELSYIRLNARSYTPFGLGRLEVAFETIHEFMGAHRFAAKLASNSVVQFALWMQEQDPAQHERLIRWWQDEIEGTGRVPILTAENKPEVLRFGVGTDADLRLAWQEFLIRVIASAFDLPPLFLGVEADVNRATAGELADSAFRTAIVPTARLFAEHITRDAIAKRLGWNDLEFVFLDLDATDPMEQAQIDQILLGSGVLTVNEARAARGWQALEKTGAQAE
ncbi:MAG TPA: phage portal protein [Candidatus Saccharimonadales bacterium]|nr:phage portal protein [Candidatus Saccharimonadales bacterium]